jgi:predicted anti-sigma-YlaC factor YlaD
MRWRGWALWRVLVAVVALVVLSKILVSVFLQARDRAREEARLRRNIPPDWSPWSAGAPTLRTPTPFA